MRYLTGAEYVTLADRLGSARNQLQDCVTDLFTAVYEVVHLNTVPKEVDLLMPFWGSYKVAYASYLQTTTLDAGVRAINNHVLRRSVHENLDAYLSEENVQVTQTFADLSTAIGFPITSGGNIVPG